MTAGENDFAWLASTSLPPVDGESWNGYDVHTMQAPPPVSQPNGRSGLDLNRIQRLSIALQERPETSASPTESPLFVSVQEMIHERRDNIINKLFYDEMQKTRECCDLIHAMRLKTDWEEQKERYMQEIVADRRLGGSSNATTYQPIHAASSSSNSNIQFQIADHLRLINDMKHKTDRVSTIYEFARLASNSQSYAATWKLVYALQQRKSDSALGRAIATMSHLSRQFQAYISNRVRSASASGASQADSKFTGTARTVEIYVNLTVGSHASHWATIFYCLRSGDFVGAKQVLDVHDPSHLLAPTLEAYAKQQGSEAFFWDRIAFVNANPIANHHPTSGDEFENDCLSFLSGPNLLESPRVVRTIEDFVYVSIWHAIIGATETHEALVAIGAKIKEFGPNHFEGDGLVNTWSYVTPLLLTQQYFTAMLHLAESDGECGVLQATHLGLFLPELQDLGEPTTRCLLTNLLVEFASKYTARNPSNALQYLVLIPNPAQKRKKVVDLIADSRQFEELAGVLSAEGVRMGERAALDQHFPRTVVCDLLHDAALVAHGRNNMRDALELLNLAERYVTLLSMLNEKLASTLNQGPGKEKEFWIKACRDFDNWHFSGRRTHAIEVIEANNSLALVDVFHTLLNLCNFFDRLMMHAFKEATSIIDGMHLLPQSSDELQAKASSYNASDPILKQAFPLILEGAMDSLYQQFVRTKYSGIAGDATALEERRRDMKRRASFITSFAGALQLPLNLRSRMASMEAQMI